VPRTTTLALLCALSCAACAPETRVVPEVRVERHRVPAALLTCPPRPPVPAEPWTERVVAGWLLDVEDAYGTCTARMDEVRRMVDVD
jgi:hypothetical protein